MHPVVSICRVVIYKELIRRQKIEKPKPVEVNEEEK